MSKSVRHASKTGKICSSLTKATQILVQMSDGFLKLGFRKMCQSFASSVRGVTYTVYGQNGPNPKRPRPKRPKSVTKTAQFFYYIIMIDITAQVFFLLNMIVKTAQLFFLYKYDSQNGPTFFLYINMIVKTAQLLKNHLLIITEVVIDCFLYQVIIKNIKLFIFYSLVYL